jgi:hypothetical protein
VSSEKCGLAGDRVARQGAEYITSCFKPPEGVLAFLSELAVLKEPRLRLFDGSLDLGVTMNVEVTVRDEIRNNDSVRSGGGLVNDLWSGDRNGAGTRDLDSDLFVNLRACTGGGSKPLNDSRDAALKSPGHRSDPELPSRGRFLSRHLRRNGEEPRYSEDGLS